MATKAEILEGLNEQQKDAVVNYHGKISLEAIPGSGKTHTMVSRCQYMIKDGVKPSRILVFTFTKKAAEELRERIRKNIGPDADTMTISTYHSFCGKLLRKYSMYANRSNNFSIYDEDDKKEILDKIVSNFFKNQSFELKYKQVCKYISDFKTANKSPAEAKASAENSWEKASAFIYEAYEKEMVNRNAFDFDDLPFHAYRIANKYKEVREELSARYDYIMSDENQDANKQNMDFIILLGSKSGNIMVVGDSDQSIYGFRGADIKNVMETCKRENFETKFLNTNYRSTQTIVRAADDVIKRNKQRIDKDSDTINSVGEKIKVVSCKSAEDEAHFIATSIRYYKERHKYGYKDFAILCRLQRQTRIFEKIFLQEHIPFYLKGVLPFYSRTEIKDILAYIKLAYNPFDLTAFERVVNVPKRGIGKETIKKILLSINSVNDIIEPENIDKLGITKNAKNGLKEFISIIKRLKTMILEKEKVSEMIEYVKTYTNYLEHLKKESVVPSTYEEKKINISDLIFLAGTFNDVEEFLSQAVLDDPKKDFKDQEAAGDTVTIMTMHSSKGLEYETVFLPGIGDDVMPATWVEKSADDIEEERRLFYVAMTRAKKNLLISYSKSNIDLKGTYRRDIEPSSFIKEIPKEYIKEINL